MLSELFDRPQFSVPQSQKQALLLPLMHELTTLHRDHCPPYARILDGIGYTGASTLEDLPYLPVSLFKTHYLSSVGDDDVFKMMTSSGTTGQAVSRVVLDRRTATLQARALTAIMTRVLGHGRRPMIIIDTPNVVKDRAMFSARGAGVLGMLPFGRRHFYALDDEMRLDLDGLRDFLDHHAGQPVLVFGFTFMVWKYFVQALPEAIDLPDSVLIHSGGWKKLQDEAVGNAAFKALVGERTGIRAVHNFYGMVEQTGSVFLEGEDGFLYPPNFSEVIIREPGTWAPLPDGQPGVVEVLSVLPHSYPGHVLLTEDLGVVHGTGAGPWHGRQLEILGRLPRSELRGCSDTHAFDRSA